MCERRELLLKNRQGDSLRLYLRKYQEGDEEGMISCIRDEYGDSYVKQDFYNPAYFRIEAREGRITFLAAETEDGMIAGMLILKQSLPRETMCEIASQIFRKKYRGYGLAMPFFEYAMEILLSRPCSAALCRPVLYHDITQRLMGRLGFKAVGVVLNTFDMEKTTHSYGNGRNGKHSFGIQVRALGKRDVGRLYLPSEHQSFCRSIYESLGVGFCIVQEEGDGQEGMSGQICEPAHIPPVSVIDYKQYAGQSSMEIHVSHIGKDFPERIAHIHAAHPLQGRQTASVFLNCNDPFARWAYRKLEHAGYFFTGLQPLCSEKEYIILHHPGEVETWLEDYAAAEEFLYLFRYIRKNMGAHSSEQPPVPTV